MHVDLSSHRHRGTRAFAASTLGLAATFAAAAPHYDGTVIVGPDGESASAVAIGASGVVVGSTSDPGRPNRARTLVYTPRAAGSFAPLGRPYSVGHGISSAGDVAGVMYESGHGVAEGYVRRSDGTTVPVQVTDARGPLDTFAGAVNAAGTVVGFYEDRGAHEVACSWRDGVATSHPSTLGGAQSAIYDVNDAGLMVGMAELSPTLKHAAAWSPDGTLTDLDASRPDQASVANGASADGWISGVATFPPNGELHGAVWRDGQLVDLAPLPGGSVSQAFGINASHVVVGDGGDASGNSHAIAWIDGRPNDLGPITTLPDGLTLSGARGIADDGTILAVARNGAGQFVDVLLKPRAH